MKESTPADKFSSLKTLILQLQLILELSQFQEILSTYSDFLLFFAEYTFLFETSPTGTSLSQSTSTPSDTSFSSQDPARDGGNWVVYCKGNPIVFTDLDGKVVIPIEDKRLSNAIMYLYTKSETFKLQFDRLLLNTNMVLPPIIVPLERRVFLPLN